MPHPARGTRSSTRSTLAPTLRTSSKTTSRSVALILHGDQIWWCQLDLFSDPVPPTEAGHGCHPRLRLRGHGALGSYHLPGIQPPVRRKRELLGQPAEGGHGYQPWAGASVSSKGDLAHREIAVSSYLSCWIGGSVTWWRCPGGTTSGSTRGSPAIWNTKASTITTRIGT